MTGPREGWVAGCAGLQAQPEMAVDMFLYRAATAATWLFATMQAFAAH
jgi:hypothetical protein